MINKIYLSILFVVAVFPEAVFAEATIQGGIIEIKEFLGLLIPVVVGIALLFFLWGMARLIFKAGDEKAREEAKRIMVWGVVALFVIVSLWGIVALLQMTFFGGEPIYNLPLNNTP